MTTAPHVRLHLFFAVENDRAVIARQGPSRQFRMILWHRDTDTFEDGQWVKNKLYVDRCTLSPDGQHFLYFMLDGRWHTQGEGSYSAISRPPYWTALALFPEGSTWDGGGAFLDNQHYFAVGGPDIIGRTEGLSRVDVGTPGKGCATGIRLTNGKRAPLDRTATRRLLGDQPAADIAELRGRLAPPASDAHRNYVTADGKLYGRNGDDLNLIRDFTDMAFERIVAPYDERPISTEVDDDPTQDGR